MATVGVDKKVLERRKSNQSTFDSEKQNFQLITRS